MCKCKCVNCKIKDFKESFKEVVLQGPSFCSHLGGGVFFVGLFVSFAMVPEVLIYLVVH